MRDLRYAFRTLLNTPFVNAVAILSLALGIGANAAIYSLFDQILLRPLPVAAPNELVNLNLPGPIQGNDSCNQSGCGDGVIWSYPMVRDLERTQTVLAGVAGHRIFGASIALGDEPTVGEAIWVTGAYFPTLGLRPALGRLLETSDNEPGADNMVAVISHRFWMDRFGGRPDAIGQLLRLNGRAFTIVGVAPEGFDGTTLGARPLVYIPMQSRTYVGTYKGLENRRDYWVYVFGRRKAGMSLEATKAGLDRVIAPILADVEAPLQKGMSDLTMARFKAKRVIVEPGARGQSSMHREARTPLTMLFAITAVVLLIACAKGCARAHHERRSSHSSTIRLPAGSDGVEHLFGYSTDLSQLALELVDLVAQARRFFETQVARRVLHLVGEALDETAELVARQVEPLRGRSPAPRHRRALSPARGHSTTIPHRRRRGMRIISRMSVTFLRTVCGSMSCSSLYASCFWRRRIVSEIANRIESVIWSAYMIT